MDKSIPIVLAHGIARFDALTNIGVRAIERVARYFHNLSDCVPTHRAHGVQLTGNRFTVGRFFDRFHYFRNIKTTLEQAGYTVIHSDVSFAGSLKHRAEMLTHNIRVVSGKYNSKVHVIAHSMGGLDTRFSINESYLDDHVACLTTIGTPHIGSSYADWGAQHGLDKISKILKPFIDVDGLRDLTAFTRIKFNTLYEHREAVNAVRYRACYAYEDYDRVFTPLRESWKIIFDEEGPNDGLVSVESQKWKPELIGLHGERKQVEQIAFPFPADHFNECGWWDVHEPQKRRVYEQQLKDFYLQLAAA